MRYAALFAATILLAHASAAAAETAAACDAVMSTDVYIAAGGSTVDQIEGPLLTQLNGTQCGLRMMLGEVKDMTAEVQVTVDRDGRVQSPEVLSASTMCWRMRVKRWMEGQWSREARFSKPTIGGNPVCVRLKTSLTLNLRH